ncbi:MAG: DegV family protein [Bacilli bacterium]
MIHIITDTGSDITKEDALRLGIQVIPMIITIGEKEYKDGIDLNAQEFYEKLIESDELPKTSQINPYRFVEEFEKLNGEEALVILMSKELSGTYQSACLAAQDFPNVHIINSNNVAVGEKILVILAHDLIKQGKSAQEVVEIIEEKKNDVCLIALLDTLEYLKKGGRISSTTAFFGEMLSIKPVIEIRNGKVEMIGKARGSKNANNKLREFIAAYNGIDFSLPYELAYTGLSRVMLDKYIKDSQDLYGDKKLYVSQIGPTIGTHAGPGAIAVAFFKNK